jgi:hypothetical protein
LLGSIFQVGGDSVKTPYETEYLQNPTSPIITVAAAGQLTSKKIYFLPWEPNKDATLLIESIKTFVSNAMKKARAENYQSIAFPAIGCGEHGCPISVVAQTIINEIRHQLTSHPMSIFIVIQPERTDIFNEFQRQINILNKKRSKIKVTSVSIGKGKIEVEKGDITQQKVTREVQPLMQDIFSLFCF